MNWDFLKSRAFWSALGPFVSSVCILLEVSEAKTAAIVAVVSSFAGFWAVTIARSRSAEPSSYAAVMRTLAAQQETIAALKDAR